MPGPAGSLADRWQPRRAVAVFDANVYSRAIVAVANTGSWQCDWTAKARTLDDASLFALVAASAPEVEARVVFSMYSSSDLDDLVVRKLSQPNDDRLADHRRGLGWPEREAERAYRELCATLGATGRSFLIEPAPAAAPLAGADYEDRCVWGLFRAAMDDRPGASPFLVTADRAFAFQINAEALRPGRLQMAGQAVSPSRFCEIVAST